jgi:hypothetical protein
MIAVLQRWRLLCVFAALLVSVAVVATATPARATGAQALMASASCDVWPFTSSCRTDAIPANASHKIYWLVGSGGSGQGCSWRVRDITIPGYPIVGSGRIGAIRERGDEIGGLYGRYRLELYNCWSGAYGSLSS